MIDIKEGMLPTAVVRKRPIIFTRSVPANAFQQQIGRFLTETTEALLKNGYQVIGHIKGVVTTERSGHMMFSLTSIQEGPRFKGELSGEITCAEMVLNIIVYGIEKTLIERLVEDVYTRYWPAEKGWSE